MQKRITVVSFTGDSGLTDYSVSLCKELDAFCELTFMTAESYKPEKYGANFNVVKLFRRTRHYPLDIVKFFISILTNKPDILLFQSWIKYPIFESVLLRVFKLFGIQLALTIHDLMPHYPKPWSRVVLSKYYRCFDKIIVHSAKAKSGLLAMGVDINPMQVPHGVYDIFKYDALSKPDVMPFFPTINEDDFVVLFFGHLQTRKGLLAFLKASDLLAKEKNIKLIVAGRNDLDKDAKETLSQYGNNAQVLIHDHMIPMEEVQHYFVLSDVIALPYLEGTTSGVVKLAMAFDKPIIATDIGDFSETLNDWSGVLIDSNNVAENLASAIVDVRSQYGSYINDLAKNKEKFQWDNIAKQYFNYLTE